VAYSLHLETIETVKSEIGLARFDPRIDHAKIGSGTRASDATAVDGSLVD